ncbi:uncharacterized protein LY89DRAFT_198170 [Mollisia scopiformis]|uniref:Uncharacterized protein n=1 Tax=Mollisia scopiformis TaxID=149040 RepID=A0A194WZ66_MOLSC|nr:uncharacterized protein LY89DRAFT_198170 [Mollisia scopiformis]KUJ13004.1 hypothetical protein LY89DRAFT_198170 [Mollisia scopiformis]
MATFQRVGIKEARLLLPGTILWLPPKDQIEEDRYTSPLLLDGAFNHPVVILSFQEPNRVKYHSWAEIAIITSFHGSTIKSHLAAKGIKHSTGVEAAEKAGYLRIVTASKPHAKDVLHLRDGKGMKRDSAYVNVKETFWVEVSALAKYGLGEDLNAYSLTNQSLKKLREGAEEYKERKRVKEEKAAKKEKGAKERDGKEKEVTQSKKKVQVERKSRAKPKRSTGKVVSTGRVTKPRKSKLIKMLGKKA